MIRSVKWSSDTFLSCACEKLAPVILCVDPDIVDAVFCPVSSEEYEPGYAHISATIISYCKKGEVWNYTFQYDDSQLVEGEAIQFADIEGAFCDDCKAQWAREQIGDEMYLTSEDGGDYLLYTPHGCEYSFPKPGGMVLDFLFGTGSDGDLTVLNGENLILPNDPLGRSFFFQNLTIDQGGILMPLGERYDGEPLFYQIFVNGTLTINGTLHVNANNGANGVGATPGAAGGVNIGGIGPGGRSICGGDGGRGTSGAGASQAGDTLSYIGPGVCSTIDGFMGGGAGGDGGNGGDGSAGGVIDTPLFFRIRSLMLRLINFSAHSYEIDAPIYGGTGGAGGGGGGRTGTAEGGAGGGGGGGAGTIWIAARNIVIGSTGAISANGGDGGNGADGTPGGGGDTAGGGGGGGAGGGGLIYLVYENLTNNGAMQVNPGNAGAGGAGVNGGTAGSSGATGNTGQIVLLNMRTGLFE